jgi:hypothetical protein
MAGLSTSLNRMYRWTQQALRHGSGNIPGNSMGHQWPRPQTSPARTGSPSSPHAKRIVLPWSPLAYQVDLYRKESDRRTITHGASIGWMALYFLKICLANWHPFARTPLNRSWWIIPRSIATFSTWVFDPDEATNTLKKTTSRRSRPELGWAYCGHRNSPN